MKLGIIYENGSDTGRLHTVSTGQKGGEQGDAVAQLNIGIMYEYGRGAVRTTVRQLSGIKNLPSRDIQKSKVLVVLLTKRGGTVIQRLLNGTKIC